VAERILLGVVIIFAAAIGWLFVAKRKGSPSEIATQSVGVMILSVLLVLAVIVAAVVLYTGVIGGLG
jgi:hypothetical protein